VSKVSTKPYLIRAIFDWCAESGLTPYLAVQVDDYTQVPMSHVKDGKIIINISVDAVRNLQIGNDDITCGGRFGGVAYEIIVPVAAVIGIFSKETGQGLVFQGQESSSAQVSEKNDEIPDPPSSPPPHGKPKLTVVK
jgi:stringent starvation protein B